MSNAHPRVFRGWRAAVLLAVAAFFTPDQAFAGCGDYITYPGDHPATSTNNSDMPVPAKAPCHGPNCQGNTPQEFPPVPSAPVTSSVKEHARLISLLNLLGGPIDSHFDRDRDSAQPIDRAFAIFHPPRLG
ncbi:MAG TPA: hypothetical protein VLM40_05380 [Gemmata sp.]|nr:hypothetical protein [Gemmata sp.]